MVCAAVGNENWREQGFSESLLVDLRLALEVHHSIPFPSDQRGLDRVVMVHKCGFCADS